MIVQQSLITEITHTLLKKMKVVYKSWGMQIMKWQHKEQEAKIYLSIDIL